MNQRAAIRAMYEQADDAMNRGAGVSIGFDAVLGAAPCPVDAGDIERWHGRYVTIRAFQEQALALFRASLDGEADPSIASMIVGDLPDRLGLDYHRRLTDRQHHAPVFFRTDELVPGTLSEVQCPGSAWDFLDLLRDVYAEHPSVFGTPRFFATSASASLAGTLRRYLSGEPVIHHLVDNASRPHGMRYFIQRTRTAGIRYFGYDRDVGSRDCTFVRSHDFISLRYHNFFPERLARCDEGTLRFDLCPSALFDGKLIMAWPFWSRTRDHFSDDVRALFPRTSIVTPEGLEMEDGSRVSLDGLFGGSSGSRDYYVKYAGTDVALNWGSRAVFRLKRSSVAQRRDLQQRIRDDWTQGRYWILQPSVRQRKTVGAFTRDGEVSTLAAYAKWSAFYGPDGLLGLLAFHRNYHKVHGSSATVLSIAY